MILGKRTFGRVTVAVGDEEGIGVKVWVCVAVDDGMFVDVGVSVDVAVALAVGVKVGVCGGSGRLPIWGK